ncbi:MAG: hypothetical protein QM775_36970 [Pirellulales bacterium]
MSKSVKAAKSGNKSGKTPSKREAKRREVQSERSRGGPKRRGPTESGAAATQTLGSKKPAAGKSSAGFVAPEGAAAHEQDPKRRLGNFKSAGEASRKGGRTKGIVGHHKRNVRGK